MSAGTVARRLVFLTGGTGFIGRAVLRHLVGDGHRVEVLVRSEEGAAGLRELGAHPVRGDLIMAGPWQRAAAMATWVLHLAQPLTFGGKVTLRRAEAYRQRRLVMDRHLLAALSPSSQRIIYVGGTSYYGDLGAELHDEDVAPRPCGWGPFVAPAIEALDRHLQRGLPIVTAFPGAVYGDGSWFRLHVLRPLLAGKRLLRVGGRSRYCSPIHVEDCARALVHLASVGEAGRRYFVVDDRPAPFQALAEVAARALQVPLRFLRVPGFVARLMVGPVVMDSLRADAMLSNARLRATGFAPRFPTIDEGIPEVVRQLAR